jgi:hypothetical protein
MVNQKRYIIQNNVAKNGFFGWDLTSLMGHIYSIGLRSSNKKFQ